MFVPSLYNVVKTQNDVTWVYNTLTSAFIKTDPEDWRRLNENTGCLNDDSPLVKSGFFVKDNSDEIKQYKYLYRSRQFKSDSLFIYIAPTMQCNFNCFYCFEKGNKNHGIMTDEIEDRLIRFLTNSRYTHISIVWFGGEPLMGYERIISICNRLKENNVDYSSSLITNGSLLTESKINLLHKLNLKFIQISMDGVGKDQDSRRCFINGGPTFDIIIGNIRKLIKKTDIPIVIQITVDKDNKNAYEEMTSYVAENFREEYISGRIKIGRNHVENRTGHDCSGKCFTNEEILEEEIRSLTAKSHDMTDLPGLSMPCGYRCKASFAIDSNGDIFKCIEHLGTIDNKVGSLANGKISLSEIVKTAFENDPFEDEECLKCNVFPICGGGCPIDRKKCKEGRLKSCCSRYKDSLEILLPYIASAKYYAE